MAAVQAKTHSDDGSCLQTGVSLDGNEVDKKKITPLRSRVGTRSDAAMPAIGMVKGGNPEPDRKLSTGDQRVQKLEALLLYENELRNVLSLRELVFLVANETLRVCSASQVFVLRPGKMKKAALVIDAVSHLASVDRNAPLIVELESAFERIAAKTENRHPEGGSSPEKPSSISAFPFDLGSSDQSFSQSKGSIQGVYLPLVDRDNRPFAALVFVGDGKVLDRELPVLDRIGKAVSHSWLALNPKPLRRISPSVRKMFVYGGTVAAMATMFIPVPLSTLAPVEIVALRPHVVAAPIDGVIDQIAVEPNSLVQEGDVLFRYVDTALTSSESIARQKRGVAAARLQNALQNSFGRGEGRRDVAVAEAELALADAELGFAVAQFKKSNVVAPRAGIAVIGRKSEWQGKPVSVGERVLEIADADEVEAKIDLPVSDAIVIKKSGRVKLFLDANPLSALEAEVASAGYRAAAAENNTLAFRVDAKLQDDNQAPPRIGARGTAQIFGDDVPLWFFLFRKPLSVIRQWIGR